MTDRDETAMLAGILAYKREMQTAAQLKAAQDFCTYREALNVLRRSLDAVDAECGRDAKRLSIIPHQPHMDAVVGAVALACHVPIDYIMARSNEYGRVFARGVAYLMMSELGYGASETGRYFGKHHTSILHGIEVAKQRVQQSKTTAELVDSVRAELRPEVVRKESK